MATCGIGSGHDMNHSLFAIVLVVLSIGLACVAKAPALPPTPAPTVDIGATVAAAVAAALPTATPTPTPNIGATVEARLQAIMGVMPSPIAPAPTPTPTSKPIPPTPTPLPTATSTSVPKLTLAEMVEMVRPSVVRIETSLGDGSGFIFEISQTGGTALVMTNAHVIEGATWITVTINDSATVTGEILGLDPAQDLAVLKICCGRFQALEFGDANSLRAGTGVVAIGYPSVISGKASVTDGIVSAVRYDDGLWVIQTDAAINPGNSGGPLLSLSGEVLGINTFRYETTRTGRPVEGIGFAVSEVTIMHQLSALKSGYLLPTPTPRAIPTPTRTPTPVPPPTPDANGYLNKGNAFFDGRQFVQAIDQFTAAIQLNPRFVNAYTSRALAHSLLNQHEQAIKDWDQAIRLEPRTVGLYMGRGFSYRLAGQYQRSIQDYDQAIRLNPQISLAYSGRGASYTLQEQYPRAIQDYDDAIRLDPRDAESYDIRGMLYGGLGQAQREKADRDKACQLDNQYCLWTAVPTLIPVPTREPSPALIPAPTRIVPTPRPPVFGGTVYLDGAPAPNGIQVSAWIDGVQVASTTVIGGNYAFVIPQPPGAFYQGKEITFMVGAATASQTGTWEADGGAELNLTANSPK